VDNIVAAIEGINTTGGGDDPEDVLDGLQAAVRMPWREGVAKFILLMGDAPAKDPDHEGKTKDTIAEAARAVDPAHIYALALGNAGIVDSGTLDSFRGIAAVTDGEAFAVEDASKIGEAIENAVSAAIVHHPSEVGGLVVPGREWETPLLVSALVGIFILSTMCIAIAIRRRSLHPSLPETPIAWLQVHEPRLAPRNAPIFQPVASIGRDPNNDVVVADPRVSTRHAEVRIDAGTVTVVDLGSTNGTWFDDERVDRRNLHSGECFKVGDTMVYYFPAR
jgi:hypothetical protein